ncbi:hypothetical protein MSG28_015754 [Choristoneura fumiferana]|uniref:Uncharacterized protein n=1 Tax=Choristoneura fumiferana TaxID=7141 RepID=A0ACC0KBQ2_CHOFU|nr:hypothetical protein MSG28_015754 [Choristoneura fumiferana]
MLRAAKISAAGHKLRTDSAFIYWYALSVTRVYASCTDREEPKRELSRSIALRAYKLQSFIHFAVQISPTRTSVSSLTRGQRLDCRRLARESVHEARVLQECTRSGTYGYGVPGHAKHCSKTIKMAENLHNRPHDTISNPRAYCCSKMAIHIKDADDLKTRLSEAGDKLVVIDFMATWCGPCKMIGPKLEEMANEMADVLVVLKVSRRTGRPLLDIGLPQRPIVASVGSGLHPPKCTVPAPHRFSVPPHLVIGGHAFRMQEILDLRAQKISIMANTKKLTREEILAKDRLRIKQEYIKIKSDPELHRLQKKGKKKVHPEKKAEY